jgi:hypothetical protein
MRSTSDGASRLRELARQLDSLADNLDADASRPELDNIVAELRVLIVRRFGRKPRGERLHRDWIHEAKVRVAACSLAVSAHN